MPHLITNRYQAFAIHLLISLVLISAIWLLMRLIWFPGALFDVSQTWDGLQILILVDLVLGPLLTLVVFNLNNKTRVALMRDLAVIFIFQLSGLIAGVNVVQSVKPVALVYTYDTFHVVTQRDLDKLGIEESAFRPLDQRKPALIATAMPDNKADAKAMVLLHSFIAEVPLPLQSERWVTLEQQPVGSFSQAPETQSATVTEGTDCDGQRVKIKSSRDSGTACFNHEQGSFTDFKSDI